ncbi:MAG: zf-HC2 domain-containing protein [Pirellulales bacterium]
MKRCTVTEAKLGDHLDRRLSLEESQRLDRHLEECAACRGAYQRLVALRTLVDGLATSIEPQRDLWPAISARLCGAGASHSERERRRIRLAWIVLSAAAASILVALGVIELSNRPASTSGPAQNIIVDGSPALDDSLRLEVAKAEQAYVDAAGDFLAHLKSPEAALPPDTRIVLEGNLVIADRAISEIKSAWERQPSEFALARKLLAAHERRVELLQQVAHLSFATQNGG